MKYSIIVPFYNEEKNVLLLNEEINKAINSIIKDSTREFEIIYVDDGSKDKTYEKMLECKKNQYKTKLIRHKYNLSQSSALFTGIKFSNYDNLIFLDGDGQNDPIDIIKLVKLYNTNKYGLVGGLRLKRKDNIIKRISSLFANYIRNLVLKDNCRDTGCSLKIFSKTIFMKMPYFDGIHRFLPALFKAYGCVTTFIPVNHRHRKFGTSNYGTFDRAIRGIRDLIKVYFLIRKLKND